MDGQLYVDKADSNHIKVGTLVLIHVNDANRPAGTWEGMLVSFGPLYEAIEFEDHLPGVQWTTCQAIIIDPHAPGEYIGRSPIFDYTAYIMTSGVKYLAVQLLKAREEIKTLKKQADAERDVFYNLFKSLVDPQTVARVAEEMKKAFP